MPVEKTTRQKDSLKAPANLLAPVDIEEFKFCFRLAEAAYDGRMPSARPTATFILKDEVFHFAEVPHNRVLMAIATHFKETRGDPWSRR